METDCINIQTFIRNLQLQLHELPAHLDGDTRLLDLPGWTSLQALIVVASFAYDYGVTISDDEFRQAKTVRDLYTVVSQRMGN